MKRGESGGCRAVQIRQSTKSSGFRLGTVKRVLFFIFIFPLRLLLDLPLEVQHPRRRESLKKSSVMGQPWQGRKGLKGGFSKNLVFSIGSFLSVSRRGGRVFFVLNMADQSGRRDLETQQLASPEGEGGGGQRKKQQTRPQQHWWCVMCCVLGECFNCSKVGGEVAGSGR